MPDEVARALATTAASASEISLFLSLDGAERSTKAVPSGPKSEVSAPKSRDSDARLAEIASMSQPTRYEEIDHLGAGGMGVVKRVFDRVLGRDTAMKILDRSESGTVGTLRFLEEAQITGQLDHPGIVPVHDFGIASDGQRSYFTMKLVRGDSLQVLISTHHKFGLSGRPLEKLLTAFTRVCEAVAFAHARRVVHRDLKPDNILIGSHGQVYVMDWGLAMLLGSGRLSQRRPGDHEIAGTPSYMAPEQARGHLDDITPRTDVFGLGAVLYAILTGQPPFKAETSIAALARARACDLDVGLLDAAPPELARITIKAMSKDPEERYPTAEELGRDIEEFFRGGGWFRTQDFAAGQAIITEGEPGSVAYVISSGRCRVFRTIDGEEITLRELGPGEVFGETAVFTSKPRSASVVAIEPTSVRVVTREALDRELDRNPWMGAFVRAVAERFREADEKLISVSLRPREDGTPSSRDGSR